MPTYIYRRPASPVYRIAALGMMAAVTLPTLAGCGSSAPPPPVDRSGTANLPPSAGGQVKNSGMSKRTKVVLLVGAAALYYMWKKKQNAQGQTVQYYQSKTTGRIYYRDPKTHQAIWVTPEPIQVPAEEAQNYSGYQGYDNRQTGQPFGGWNNGRLAPEGE